MGIAFIWTWNPAALTMPSLVIRTDMAMPVWVELHWPCVSWRMYHTAPVDGLMAGLVGPTWASMLWLRIAERRKDSTPVVLAPRLN